VSSGLPDSSTVSTIHTGAAARVSKQPLSKWRQSKNLQISAKWRLGVPFTGLVFGAVPMVGLVAVGTVSFHFADGETHRPTYEAKGWGWV
jgi:hypothetical protein